MGSRERGGCIENRVGEGLLLGEEKGDERCTPRLDKEVTMVEEGDRNEGKIFTYFKHIFELKITIVIAFKIDKAKENTSRVHFRQMRSLFRLSRRARRIHGAGIREQLWF